MATVTSESQREIVSPFGDETTATEIPDAPPHPTPTAADAIRAFSVVYGPSAILDLVVLASVGTLAGAAVRTARGKRASCLAARLVTPLAGVAVAATAAYLTAGRRWLRSWGATPEECARPLPGDDDVPDPAITSTWAVTIDAPAQKVWPWLAQIGQDRGGFYSYTWLENLAGCQLHNADEVHPEWQERKVGEWVPLHPVAGLPLSVFEPGHALALLGWGSFVLEPIDELSCRLITRSRVKRGWQAVMYSLLTELPHFIMQRKMMLGIKQRAEREAATG
jgi:hypothetical protein